MQNKKLLPLNLQFFAESPSDSGSADASADIGENATDNKPSYDDLMAQLAQERAEKSRLKTAVDKASKEAADYKNKYRSRISEEEQASEDLKAQMEARDREYAEMKLKYDTMEATKDFMALEMDEDFAAETAKAEVSGDRKKVMANLAKHIKALKEQANINSLRDREKVNSGHGDDSESSALKVAKQLYGNKPNEAKGGLDILKQYL